MILPGNIPGKKNGDYAPGDVDQASGFNPYETAGERFSLPAAQPACCWTRITSTAPGMKSRSNISAICSAG